MDENVVQFPPSEPERMSADKFAGRGGWEGETIEWFTASCMHAALEDLKRRYPDAPPALLGDIRAQLDRVGAALGRILRRELGP